MVEVLLIGKWLVLEHSRLPDYTLCLRTRTSRDLLSPGATFSTVVRARPVQSSQQDRRWGPSGLFAFFRSFLQGSFAPPTTEVIPREQF